MSGSLAAWPSGCLAQPRAVPRASGFVLLSMGASGQLFRSSDMSRAPLTPEYRLYNPCAWEILTRRAGQGRHGMADPFWRLPFVREGQISMTFDRSTILTTVLMEDIHLTSRQSSNRIRMGKRLSDGLRAGY